MSVRFRRLFLPLSRFPKPSASASRLPNAGTSLATLLSFANAVVTRRRVQVYTLPLSAPGSLSAPWPPTFLRQAPIAVEHSRLLERRSSRIASGTFSTRVRRQFRLWLSPGFPLPSRFRLATPRPILWALSHSLRRCDSAVHSGLALPLNHPGRFRAPWPPSSCARLSRPSVSLRCRKCLLVTQVRLVFPGPFEPFPSSRSQPRGVLSVGVSHTTLLSIAIGVVARRRAQVCTLPLNHSGWFSAPWPPTTCARLPLQAPG